MATVQATSRIPPTLDKLPSEIIFKVLETILRNWTRCPNLDGIEEEDHLELGYDRPWLSHPQIFIDFEERVDKWEYDRFVAWSAALALASTCRRLYDVVTPEIYRLDVKYSRASALLISARQGNASAVRWSLANGAPVDQADYTLYYHDERNEYYPGRPGTRAYYARAMPRRNRITALHWATIFGHEDIVDILLAHGADPTCREARGALIAAFGPALSSYCLSRATTHRMEYYTSHYEPAYGSSVFPSLFRTKPGVNPLYYATLMSVQPWAVALQGRLHPSRPPPPELDVYAVRLARLRIAKKLIQAGSSLVTDGAMCVGEKMANRGQGAILCVLHQAAAECNADLLDFLLSPDGGRGLNPNLRDYAGFVPLHYLFYLHPEFVDDSRYGSSSNGGEPLDAHLRDAERTLDVLVRHGADVNRAMPTLITALGRCLAEVHAGGGECGGAREAVRYDAYLGLDSEPRPFLREVSLRHRVHFAGAVALLRRGAALMPVDMGEFAKLTRCGAFVHAFQTEKGLPPAVFARLPERLRGVAEAHVRRAFFGRDDCRLAG
ncbi:hypothetical protein PG993_000114 [Apiospora rasikravindrae]|uniref:Uncharacterized protein n=1 Tax=Apiospora rasikravindrae TaxID=990691 RepID=A0ABR1U7N6_9PEZI